MIRRILLLLVVLLGPLLHAYATHIRGGEIIFERVPNNQLAIRCTLNIYRDKSSQVVDAQNTLYFGDGTSQTSPAVQPVVDLPGKNTEIYTYYYEHTYSSFGIYTLYHHRQYRNSTVNNIGPNPDQVEFYVETQLKLLPQLDINGPNHSPRLDKPAVDLAKLGFKYFYDPAAYDPDGDSLSFEIIPSRTFLGENLGTPGQPITNYTLPNLYAGGQDSARSGPATLTISPIKGLMTWDVPNRIGEYNVAIKIGEWRNGFQIGFVVRDMQILVKDVPNKPPYLILPADTCVVAGDTIDKTIYAKDPDVADYLTIVAAGGVFHQQPLNSAVFSFPTTGAGQPIPQPQIAHGEFHWETQCGQVSDQPYVTVFTAEDNKPREIQLADVKPWTIRVIGPKPKIISAVPLNNTIRVTWEPYVCRNNIRVIQVWRRINHGPTFDSCQTGIPDGYTLIGTTDSAGTTFLDDNGGQGLKFGAIYCYRLVAVFKESRGGESRPSDEVCARLAITVPLITKVSVAKTDSIAGEMDIVWTSPFELDTVLNPGPFQVLLKRTPVAGGPTDIVYTTTSLKDTVFTDRNLDTKQKLYTYQVLLITNPTPNGRDSSFPAQNINLRGAGTKKSVVLNWTAEVPWFNAGFPHTVYKYQNGNFVPLDTVTGTVTTTLTDDGLRIPFEVDSDDNKFGRYYVTTRGAYDPEIFRDTLINDSYEIRVYLADSIPPCPPQNVKIQNANLTCPSCAEYIALEVKANRLTWNRAIDTCQKDLALYKIYYKAHQDDPWTLIASTQDTTYLHENGGSMAGCYKVTTADVAGNELLLVDSVCNDNCVYFDLPNVFTPNGDMLNPKFTPICATSDLIRDAGFEVYNRWGVKVFGGGREALASWDGRTLGDGSLLPAGTYFYHADVQFIRLNRKDEHRNFKGWVEIVR